MDARLVVSRAQLDAGTQYGERSCAPVRLAIVTSHPIQYAAPLYAYLSRDPALALTVLYCSDQSLRGELDPGFGQPVAWDIDLLAGYDSIFLGRRALTRRLGGFWSLVCPELGWELRRARYDAVWIHGQQFAADVLAFTLAKLQGKIEVEELPPANLKGKEKPFRIFDVKRFAPSVQVPLVASGN